MASGGHETPVLYLREENGSVRQVVADLHKDVECRTEAELAVGTTLSYTEVSTFWLRETLRFIRENPGTFLSKLLMKTSHFWSTYEIPQIEHFGYFRQFSLPLKGPALTFGIVGPLAFVGMILGLARPGRWALLYLFVLFYSTSIILFFVLARYRLPILPALIPFAAYALLRIKRAWEERRWAVIVGALVLAFVVGYLMQANFYGVDEPKGIAQILYRHGIVEDSRGNYEAAIQHYQDSLRLKPQYDRCHLNLGVDLARVGRGEEAMVHLLTAERLSPEYYRPPFNRGILLEGLGRYEEAEAAYRRSVELEPRYLLGTTALAEMRILAGDLAEARELFQQVAGYDGRWEGEHNPRARARAGRYLSYLANRDRLDQRGLGRCFRESAGFRLAELARLRGRQAEALARLRRYVEDGGACPEVYATLGQVLLASNQLGEAESALRQALSLDARFPGVHLTLGRIAAARGRGEEAVRYLETEARIDPENPVPHLEIGLVYERILGDTARAERSFGVYRERGGDLDLLRSRRAPRRAGES
jgi:tetratricopeptide (TPR) repeat protein